MGATSLVEQGSTRLLRAPLGRQRCLKEFFVLAVRACCMFALYLSHVSSWSFGGERKRVVVKQQQWWRSLLGG